MTDLEPAPRPTAPTPTPEPITFGGYFKSANINARDGEWIMTIAVPLADKYAAMPATDHLGTVWDFTLVPRVYTPDDEDDDD